MADLLQILVNTTRFFGDGPPTWRQGRHRGPPERASEADRNTRRLIKVLRRHGRGAPAVESVRTQLACCSDAAPCLSGACPRCARAFQRLVVEATDHFIGGASADWCVASIVAAGERYASGALPPSTMFDALADRLNQAFDEAKVDAALGGFDVSFNESATGTFSPHWRPHAHVLVRHNDRAALSRVLRDRFPGMGSVRRPVLVKPFDGDRAAIAYALKTRFHMRVSMPGNDEAVAAEERRSPERDEGCEALRDGHRKRASRVSLTMEPCSMQR